MTGLVFLHGWGFGPHVWAHWAAAFPDRPVAVLDLGYFGPPHMDLPDNPDGWVGIGHSQGFARLLTMDVAWRGLVGFGAFLRFCSLPGRPDGTVQEVIDAMVARLDIAPAEVLRRFTRRCGQEASCTAPLDGAGLGRLRQGLAWLRDLDLPAPEVLPPTLLVHARDDRIVPLSLAQEAQGQLPGSHLEVFDTGGHALPFTRSAQCLPLVREFLRGRG